MKDFPFNKEKAINSMLHICNTLGGMWDKYSLLKILYFAEQKHLAKYGRPITGDNMIAMEYGPVPSISYNEIKYSKVNPEYFEIVDNIIISKCKANLEFLSKTDLDCLNDSIDENKVLSFGALKDKSHDSAYDWTIVNIGVNQTIPYLEIAKAAGASIEMIEFIQENLESFNLNFDEQLAW
jgi:uncharacterized phage-associated protein